MLQPSFAEAEQKKKQYDEICAKKNDEPGHNPIEEQFYKQYLVILRNYQGVGRPEVAKMVFVCKEFAIIGGLEFYYPDLRKIQLGAEWETKFVEWIDDDWECKHTIIRPKVLDRYDVMSMDKSPQCYELKDVLKLF